MIQVVQTLSHLTIVYNMAMRSPQVHIELYNDTVLHTYINRRIQFHRFADSVLWPGNVSISRQGLLVMKFEKLSHKNWTDPVTDFKVNITRANIPITWPFYIANKTEMAEGIYLVSVKPVKKMWIFINVGHHVSVIQTYEDMKQGDLRRDPKPVFEQSYLHYTLCKKIFKTKQPNKIVRIPHQYTPLPKFPIETLEIPNPLPHGWHSMDLQIDFLVRSVRELSFGNRLVNGTLGKEIELTAPFGTLNTIQWEDLGKLFVITTGTAISAVLSVILYMLQITSVETITMLYFNRHEKNIVFRDGLTSLMLAEQKFTVVHILSEASEAWRGKRGRLCLEILAEYIPPFNATGKEKDYYVAVSGHKKFNKAALKLVEDDLHYPDYQSYDFYAR